jgi:hypothetical protein
MKNKTCGECNNYNAEKFHCEKFECVTIGRGSCPDYEEKPKKPTNGDRIRQMSDEKLAEVIECPHFEGLCIHRDSEYPCKCCKRDWLKQEAKDE